MALMKIYLTPSKDAFFASSGCCGCCELDELAAGTARSRKGFARNKFWDICVAGGCHGHARGHWDLVAARSPGIRAGYQCLRVTRGWSL